MQTIRVRTAQNVFIHYPLGSLGDRIGAYMLDVFVRILYTLGVVGVFIELKVQSEWAWILSLSIPWLLYSLAFEIFMNGQTPGKRVLNIQVVRLDGSPANIGNYILRWLLAFLDFGIMSGAIALIVIIFNGKGQRLGDIAAGTTVIKKEPVNQVSISHNLVTVTENYEPVFTEASLLSSRDIELIQRALEANRDNQNSQPVTVVAAKIKELLRITTDFPDIKFLYTIVKDYNHITANQQQSL